MQPQDIPPTSAAAKYHSLRVRLHIIQWKDEVQHAPAMSDYGWKVEDSQTLPLMTNLSAAPTTLLQILRCNCASDCTTNRCTCRKNGLDCSAACGQCKGTGGSNSPIVEDTDDEDDNADDESTQQ